MPGPYRIISTLAAAKPAELSLWTEAADIRFADLIALDPAGFRQACFASGNLDMNPQ
jgi:hypothetical protein